MAQYKASLEGISNFNPDKYGGVYDTGLYLNNNTGSDIINNNAIVRVGNTYYLVGSGNGKVRLNSEDKIIHALQDSGLNGSVAHEGKINYQPTAFKITNPELIKEIEQNANEVKGVHPNRVKLGDYNNDGINTVSIVEPTKEEINKIIEQNKKDVNGSNETYYTPPSEDYSYYKNEIKNLRAELEEYKRPKSGPELAEHYGIQDTAANRGYWKGIYENDLNKMYDDLVAKQGEYRDRYTRNNGTYDDYLEKEYMNSYNNASNARTTRGAIAANALSTGNVNDYNSSKNDYNMMQSINALEAQRQADLAGVDYKAEQTYADVMEKLMSLGANHDASVVQDIVNQLGAASKKNAAEKTYAGNLASAYNTAYNGLVNARASANASTDVSRALYQYYLNQTGGNGTQASNAFINYLGKVGGGY